jgi:ABC-type sugar transport system substrate-binding protein
MNRIKLLFLLVFVLIFALVSAGCSKEPERKPAEPPVKIAFALADMNRDGNKTIKKVVDERKKRANINVTWLDARNDPAEQQKQLDELAKKKVKAVVLQPVDSGTAPALVEKLARSGIKTVVLENLPVNTPLDGYIASDHNMIGRLQARFVLEALRRAGEVQSGKMTPPPAGVIVRPEQGGQGGGQGGQQAGGQGEQGTAPGAVDYSVVAQLPKQRPLNVVILRGDPRDPMAREITAANLAALQGEKDIKILGVYDHPRWDPSAVPAGLAEIMGRGERIDVILANDSTLAMAAVEYLKLGGYEKNVLTAGAGADEKASRALVNGEHDAEVDLQPEMLGQFALDAAGDLARTGHWQYSARVENGDYSVPARIVPVRLVTAKNAYLLEQRWKELKKARKEEEESQEQQGGEQQGEQQSGQQAQQGGQQGQQGEQQGGQGQQSGKGKTILKITTRDGKTMEVEIDGEVKKIESGQ